MPKKNKRNAPQLKSPISSQVLLLVKIFLTQLGSLPLISLIYLFKLINYLSHSFTKVVTNFTLYPRLASQAKRALPFTLTKKPGRPRKTPIYRVYLKRLSYYFNKKIPNRVKFGVLTAVVIGLLLSYTVVTIQTVAILPSPTKLTSTDHPLTTEIYDRNGTLLYRIYEGRNRSLVNLNQVSPNLINATIAIEDKNFYKHVGVDFLAIIRAARNNVNNDSTQGASTLTQQLIKNTLLTPEKTYTRKVKEVVLALWTEKIYSKQEILQMYLNESPYGGPHWGVEAASLAYFGKSAKDLSLSESAYLAGLPASPTEYSPYGTHPELAKVRQKLVLEKMAEQGYITYSEAQEAFVEPLNIKPNQNNIKAPHFVMYVRDYLSKKYGDRVVSQGGLRVKTTIDLGLQQEVETIVKDEVEKLTPLDVKNGAAMVTDAKTGQILAMVGSKDYYDPEVGNYNVTLSLRQPGSSIKPVTFATGFKQGFSPGNTILDIPTNFNGYKPVNYDGKFHGPVSIRTALGSSYNIPAVKMLAEVGVENMIQTAQELGITTFTDPARYGLSLTLGGGEVKMIDMMNVYGVFAQNGKENPVTPILEVTDSNQNVLEEYTTSDEQVLQEEVAYLINSILSDNNARTPAFGPQSLLNIPGYEVAVKTGTSDIKRDNWTFGYTPKYVVGVWVGNNDNRPMNPQLTSGVTGAAPIWNKIMKGLLAKTEPEKFQRPAGIIEARVDGRRDIAAAGILPKALVRATNSNDKTVFFDTFSAYATSSASLSNSQN